MPYEVKQRSAHRPSVVREATYRGRVYAKEVTRMLEESDLTLGWLLRSCLQDAFSLTHLAKSFRRRTHLKYRCVFG